MRYAARHRIPILVGALAVGAVLVQLIPLSPMAGAEVLPRHLALDHSIPGPDSIASVPVAEVRLFFTEPPQMRATTVRVVDSGRSLMTTTPPSAYEEDHRQVYVAFESPLPPGAYVVQWRVMAQDGHVVRDSYSFRVAAE